MKYGRNSLKPLGHHIKNHKKRVRPQPYGPKPLNPLGYQIRNRPEPVYSPNNNGNGTKTSVKSGNETYNDVEERNYETHGNVLVTFHFFH